MAKSTVSVRELQQNLKRVIARVERGQVIEVTRRSRNDLVFILMSRYAFDREFQTQTAWRAIRQWLEAMQATAVA